MEMAGRVGKMANQEMPFNKWPIQEDSSSRVQLLADTNNSSSSHHHKFHLQDTSNSWRQLPPTSSSNNGAAVAWPPCTIQMQFRPLVSLHLMT
jgi:hypothetical protein